MPACMACGKEVEQAGNRYCSRRCSNNHSAARRLGSPRDRILARSERAESGCWLWTGCTSPGGYGHIGYLGRNESAHRVSYEAFVGPIPEGLEIDHLCKVRRCVNPGHLEAVTPEENRRRSESLFTLRSRQTHCKHGHPFDEANTRRNARGHRACRTCIKAHAEATQARKMERIRAERHPVTQPKEGASRMTFTLVSHTFEDFGGSSLRYDAWVEEIPWLERKAGWAFRCRACGVFSRNDFWLTTDRHAKSHRKSVPDPAICLAEWRMPAPESSDGLDTNDPAAP